MLEKLTNAFGVSGADDEVKKIILDEITPYCDKIDILKDGNIIAFKKGKKTPNKKIALYVHTDEVGFIIKDITDDGYIKFEEVGGIDSRILLSSRVFIGDNKIPGIIGIKAVHMTSKEEREKTVKITDLYIDIGASSKEETEKYVKKGDYILFDSKYETLSENKVKGKAFDNRAGVSILISLLKEEAEYDYWVSFNSLEEIGLRGAMTASYFIKPDVALILEGTTCSNGPGTDPMSQSTVSGEGAALSISDGASCSSWELNDFIIKLAEENDIKMQFKRTNRGGNDAGKIQISETGVKTAVISVPVRYIHSPVSVMDLRDYESALKLARCFVNSFGGVENA